MVSLDKEDNSLIEDERKGKAQRAYTPRNPKRHIPLVSLLLWRKMVTVYCFVWPSLASSLTTVISQAVSLKFEF